MQQSVLEIVPSKLCACAHAHNLPTCKGFILFRSISSGLPPSAWNGFEGEGPLVHHGKAPSKTDGSSPLLLCHQKEPTTPYLYHSPLFALWIPKKELYRDDMWKIPKQWSTMVVSNLFVSASNKQVSIRLGNHC